MKISLIIIVAINICLHVLSCSLQAQDGELTLNKPLYEKGQFHLKTSMASLLFHNQHFIIAGEYFIKNNTSIQLETGYTFNYFPVVIDDGMSDAFRIDADKLNFTIRSEVRFYSFSLEEERMYIAYQLLFNTGNYMDDAFGCLRFDRDGFCIENTINSFNIRRNVFASHMKYGIQYQKRRWLFDFYGGVGIRYLENTVENKLPTEFFEDDFNFFVDVIPDHDRNVRYFGMSFIFGMKIGITGK